MVYWDNIVISKQTSPGTTKQVTLLVTDDKENLSKTLSVIPFSKSTQSYPTNGGAGNETKIIDLLKIEERYTFMCELCSGTLSGDSSTTSSGRKSDLRTIFKAGGVVSLTYENTTFSAAIEKIDFTKTNFDGVEPSDNESGYSVVISFVKGTDIL